MKHTEKKLIVVDAPTGSGKTAFMKAYLQSCTPESTEYCTSERFKDALRYAIDFGFTPVLERIFTGKAVGVDDVDMVFRLRPRYEQRIVAEYLLRKAAANIIVVAGIQLEVRCPEFCATLKGDTTGIVEFITESELGRWRT